MNPGIYYDISNEDYHNGAGVSKSQLDLIDKCPALFKWNKLAPSDESKVLELDFGTAAHCLLLEPERFKDVYRKGPEVNRRTKDGREQEQSFFDDCIEKGHTPITDDDAFKLNLMRDSAMAHPVANWALTANGVSEASLYWEDKETGVLCRCRPDKIITDHHWIVDVKTTGDMDRFEKSVYEYRYHVQDSFYSDGYASQFKVSPTFIFIALSTKINCGKYPVRVFILDDEAREIGRTSYKRNLKKFSECLALDDWAGIETISLPRWAKELK